MLNQFRALPPKEGNVSNPARACGLAPGSDACTPRPARDDGMSDDWSVD